MNSDREPWVFEGTRGTVIQLVRGDGIAGPSFLPMPKSFHVQVVGVQVRLLSLCWASGPILNAPRSGQANVRSSEILQREVKSVFAEKKGTSHLVVLN